MVGGIPVKFKINQDRVNHIQHSTEYNLFGRSGSNKNSYGVAAFIAENSQKVDVTKILIKPTHYNDLCICIKN